MGAWERGSLCVYHLKCPVCVCVAVEAASKRGMLLGVRLSAVRCAVRVRGKLKGSCPCPVCPVCQFQRDVATVEPRYRHVARHCFQDRVRLYYHTTDPHLPGLPPPCTRPCRFPGGGVPPRLPPRVSLQVVLILLALIIERLDSCTSPGGCGDIRGPKCIALGGNLTLNEEAACEWKYGGNLLKLVLGGLRNVGYTQERYAIKKHVEHTCRTHM